MKLLTGPQVLKGLEQPPSNSQDFVAVSLYCNEMDLWVTCVKEP